jgi:ABC-2 type transport system ATP-binding protein
MISIEHLTKRYGRRVVVDDVSFTCEPGTVTGFLGPNGAGKSTTLRILCDLAPASSGAATIGSVRYRDLPAPGRTVGVLLDAAAVHPGRTGRETLALAATVLGADRRRPGELIEQVGLDERAARARVGTYSLGMRQRLGIAQALLGDPQVLVLDEPANGLDPEGILWMRELLHGFAAGGGCVLLSSHLLREVEAVADRLVLIRRGRVVAAGATSELLAGGGVVVRALDRVALAAALVRAGMVPAPRPDGGYLVQAPPQDVAAAAGAAGVQLVELRSGGGDALEQLFLTLTHGTDGIQETHETHQEKAS